MYISIFRWGSRSSRNNFSNVKTKAVASDSRKKKCTKSPIAAAFVAAIRSFSTRSAWSYRHKFSYLQNFDRSWSSRRCFWRRLHAVWAIFGSCHQPRSRRRSVSCDRVNVNKPKLWNFDRLLGLPGHLQWTFWRRQHVISSKYDSAGTWQLLLPSAAEQ